ncbi:hypothetical protein [Pseudomonas sp. MPB23]|jgi:hypothetical protein|uniref:hypothetical protein n=1 Tax=Pseudomonas sp. MPB23 TaxID=3388490 RepID=UPI0039850B05
MINAIHHTPVPFPSTAIQQDDATHSRKKRSIDPTPAQPSTVEFGGPAANDRHRNTGGLDSLGGGRLL